MSKILLLYASITGNTEYMADMIKDQLEQQNHEVVVKAFDFDPVYVEEVNDYDAVLVGTYTWDDGQLPYEVEDFYEDLDLVDIKGKLFAVFGSADSFYPVYGGAIDLMGDRAESLGAKVLENRLKVDMSPNQEDIERCHNFTIEIDQMLGSN